MSEYIDRAALKQELAPYEENDFSQQMDVILDIVDAQPAADVVEVRHGHWIGEIDDRDGHIWMECSECHKIRIVDDFCGACGARMDKEDEQ